MLLLDLVTGAGMIDEFLHLKHEKINKKTILKGCQKVSRSGLLIERHSSCHLQGNLLGHWIDPSVSYFSFQLVLHDW